MSYSNEQWIAKSSSFTAANGNLYRTTNPAGAWIEVTLPASGEFTVWRVGAGAVVVNAAATFAGAAVVGISLPRGVTTFYYDGSSWWANRPDVGYVTSTSLGIWLQPGQGVVAPGGTLTSWTCAVSGRVFTVGAGTPTYSATGGGNHPAIDLTDTGYLTTAHAAADNVTTMACAFAVKPELRAAYQSILGHSNASQGWVVSTSNQTQLSLFIDVGSKPSNYLPINAMGACGVRRYLDGASAGQVDSVDAFGTRDYFFGAANAPTAATTALLVGAYHTGSNLFKGLINGIIMWQADPGAVALAAGVRFCHQTGAD